MRGSWTSREKGREKCAPKKNTSNHSTEKTPTKKILIEKGVKSAIAREEAQAVKRKRVFQMGGGRFKDQAKKIKKRRGLEPQEGGKTISRKRVQAEATEP